MNESAIPTNPPPQVAEAFTSAAITALQELTQFESVPEPVPAVTAVEISNAVTATVHLMRKVPGKMTVVLDEETAKRLAARYLPNGTLLTEEIVDDVAGEIANVIAGQAKTMLKGTFYHFTMSPPVVARVASLSQLPNLAEAALAASLVFDASRLLVFVELSPCQDA